MTPFRDREPADWRDRIQHGAQRAVDAAQSAASKPTGLQNVHPEAERTRSIEAVDAVGDPPKAGWLSELVADKGRRTPQDVLVRMVRSVRSDERALDFSARDAHESAKRRARRIAMMSAATGPFASITSQLADLYGDTATVWDVVDAYALRKSDADVAAVMLVLWNVAPDLSSAATALEQDGGASVASLINERLKRSGAELLTESTGPRAIISALFATRGIVSDFSSGFQSTLVGIARPGKRAKAVTSRALALLQDETD